MCFKWRHWLVSEGFFFLFFFFLVVRGTCGHGGLFEALPFSSVAWSIQTGALMSRPAGHISVGSEPRRGRMKGQETRRRQQDRKSDQAAKFYCSHRGIYVLRE
jgi:hypothetical protein